MLVKKKTEIEWLHGLDKKGFILQMEQNHIFKVVDTLIPARTGRTEVVLLPSHKRANQK